MQWHVSTPQLAQGPKKKAISTILPLNCVTHQAYWGKSQYQSRERESGSEPGYLITETRSWSTASDVKEEM